MNTLTPAPCFHLLMRLLGISENKRNSPCLTQTGPSVHLKPSASFSILASFGMSLSKRGSLPMIEPNVFSPADAVALSKSGSAKSRKHVRFMAAYLQVRLPRVACGGAAKHRRLSL